MVVLDWSEPNVWRSWLSREAAPPLADAETARRVRSRFGALRAFHGTRPTDIASYYRHGIEPLSPARWCALAAECFPSRGDDPALTAMIARVCDVQFELVRREGERVHFCCDERLLEQRDGYHLLYGSLSLLAVAIQIDKKLGTDFKAALRARGEPVVFVCDVPTTLIEDEVLVRLVADLRAALAHAGEGGALPTPLGFHFSLPEALPPAAIVGHNRPRFVVDAVYGHHIFPEAVAGPR